MMSEPLFYRSMQEKGFLFMAKTYVPTLRTVVASAYRYGTRWQPKLEANLTAPQVTALQAWIIASLALLGALGPAPINP